MSFVQSAEVVGQFTDKRILCRACGEGFLTRILTDKTIAECPSCHTRHEVIVRREKDETGFAFFKNYLTVRIVGG